MKPEEAHIDQALIKAQASGEWQKHDYRILALRRLRGRRRIRRGNRFSRPLRVEVVSVHQRQGAALFRPGIYSR